MKTKNKPVKRKLCFDASLECNARDTRQNQWLLPSAILCVIDVAHAATADYEPLGMDNNFIRPTHHELQASVNTSTIKLQPISSTHEESGSKQNDSSNINIRCTPIEKNVAVNITTNGNDAKTGIHINESNPYAIGIPSERFMEFPPPGEVPTASEESSHCQKKREATAVKIALLLKSRKNCQSKSNDNYAKLVPHVTPCILGITVIEFGDSYEAPANAATTGIASDGTSKKKERTVTLTADDMQKRKNDVKARTTLLLSLPDEHHLRFSKYKASQEQELWAAILKSYGGNEDTKKTKKNLLKQKYGNFKEEVSETLEQTFNRLQRNMSDLDTMSLDDLYNHLKVYGSEVQKKSEPNSQNMAFISSAKHDRGNEEVNSASISTASTNVPTASANIRVASISQDTACAYIASQSNGKKISIQGTYVAGFGKSKSYMANVEENHALIADEENPTEFALIAKTSAKSEVFDNSLCSKACKKNSDSLNSKIIELTDKLCDAKNMIYHYKLALAQVESRLAEHRNQELKYCEKIRVLEFKTESSAYCIERLKKELELIKKEKEGLDTKLTGFQTASKDLDSLLESQRSDKNKEGLGYSVVPPPLAQIYSPPKKDIPTKSKTDKVETAKKPPVKKRVKKRISRSQNNTHKSFIPRPVVHRPYRPPMRPNINAAQPNRTSFNKPLADSYNKRPFQRTSVVRSQFRAPWVPTVNRNFPTVNRKFLTTNRQFPTGGIKFSTADMGNKGKAVKASACWFWKPSQNLSNKGQFPKNIDDKGFWDSGCSRHMIGNISYLSDYETFDGGYVSFDQGGCKITGKRTIKTGKLEFENVYFVKDLKTPRQHNMYSIDLNNIVPHKDLTCLVAKASADEENLKDLKVKIIRCDNRGEFRNKEMNNFCSQKGIKKEFNNARTPQQNGVAERKNKTLIEAARTMLADAKLPVTFWAKAVNTACYVQNRVLVNKSQNKTPYELFNGRTPAIGFLKPFMILNTLDNLGKFEAKGDEGYFIGYSMC
nr:ribonuclease H-like domain-containing protein [Tanacetum cinerariifolium]